MAPGPHNACLVNPIFNGGPTYLPPAGKLSHSFSNCEHLTRAEEATRCPLNVRVNGTIGTRINVPYVGGENGSVSPGHSGTTATSGTTRTTPLDHSRDQSSHLTDLSHLSPIPVGDLSRVSHKISPAHGRMVPKWISLTHGGGRGTVCKGALTSLGLLCFTSLLFALLSLTFLLELDSKGHSFRNFPLEFDSTAQEVTLALAALSLALDLCCLLVCSAQFIFALKLVKAEGGEERLVRYLQKLSASRIFAVGAFFLSIPVFLTGVILYTFSQFQRVPAIFTAFMIGLGIVICGLFMVHSIFVWQKEKSAASAQENIATGSRSRRPGFSVFNSSPLPDATIDLSRTAQVHELSTLV